MEIQQLKTFLAVAREGSITRAASLLHLSQPAVSAQVKALEDGLALTLFERTARGMRLTPDGERMLEKAEQAVAAHQALLTEAARICGRPSGALRLGVGANSDSSRLGALVARLAETSPGIEVSLHEGDSAKVVAALLAGTLDAGFFNVEDEAHGALETLEVARFGLCLVAPRGAVDLATPLEWQALASMPWVRAPVDSSCRRAMEALFERERMQPSRYVDVDRERATRMVVAGGAGLGLLHSYTAREAARGGELDVLCEVGVPITVVLGWRAARSQDPVTQALRAAVERLTPLP